MRYVLTAVSIGCILPYIVWAQGVGEFVVSVFGGLDEVAPSVPVIGSVVPVTTGQITLEWGVSTDNIAVAGYVVYRDGVSIATTTATVFDDIGLTPDTLYSYQVAAFDTSLNLSSSSVAVATSTLAVPVVPLPPTNRPAEGTQTHPQISSWSVTVTDREAVVEVVFATPVRVDIRYGTTLAYEIGVVSSEVFKREHRFVLSDLTPQTSYQFQIRAQTPRGVSQPAQVGSFFTDRNNPVVLPNVLGLVAFQQGDDVVIEYEIPAAVVLSDSDRVRIVRSSLWFPASINGGVIVYEGSAGRFIDEDVFLNEAEVFYTVYVINGDGVASSGAVTYVADTRQAAISSDPIETVSPILDPDAVGSSQGDDTTTSPFIPSSIYIQQHDQVTSLDQLITMSAQAPFTVTVPYTAVAASVRQLIISYTPTADVSRRQSFLLRRDHAQADFVGAMPALQVGGEYRVTLVGFDAINEPVLYLTTNIIFTKASPGVHGDDIESYVLMQRLLLASLLSPLVLVLLVLWVRRRRTLG